MIKELWEAFKKKNREQKPLEYAKDASGKEIKYFPRAKNPRIVSKHSGSKRGAIQKKQKLLGKKASSKLTNHERVVAGRAAKMGITVAQYKKKFSGS